MGGFEPDSGARIALQVVLTQPPAACAAIAGGARGARRMSILHIGGLAKDKDKDRDRDRERDTGSKRLERLLSTLDRDRVREVTDKVLEGTRSIGERHETISSTLQDAAAALASL